MNRRYTLFKHGETKPGVTTITLDRGGVTLLVKNVPAEICEVCRDNYLSEATTKELREGIQLVQ